MTKRAMVMAGGTGGHVFPALSVARLLQQQGVEVHWLGGKTGIENELVPNAGYQLHCIDVVGLRGKGFAQLIRAPWLILRTVGQAYGIFRRVKPDVVLGLGGFASGPGGIVAKLTGTPLIIHEQNAVPGMTNKWLAKVANKTLQAFAGTFAHKNVMSVGNPVREDIMRLPTPEQRMASRLEQPLRVLVVGGSLGALAINQVMCETLALLPAAQRPQVWHQTGKKDFERCQQQYAAAGVEAKVSAFITDMSEAYAWADLVVCRSGALTVCELMAAGCASLLIPFPYAVDDHQTANAMFLVNAGGALLRPQRELTAQALADDLQYFAGHKQVLMTMAHAARTLAKPDAAKQVADFCIEALHD